MITVNDLVKSYNSTCVLHGVCHAQERGEAVVLIGPSGCGKSTFLRCLNQLEVADSGRITIGGVTIEAGNCPRSSEQREQQRQLRLLAEEGMTMIVVTHEMQFARDMADRILFIDAGRVAESGPPEQIFSNPQQERTREFVRRVAMR